LNSKLCIGMRNRVKCVVYYGKDKYFITRSIGVNLIGSKSNLYPETSHGLYSPIIGQACWVTKGM